MRILTLRRKTLYTTLLLVLAYNINAQDQNIALNQDPKFEQLLNEKRKINPSISVNDSYKIQIFSGKSEEAKKTLTDFKQEFKNIDGTIIFNTPNYKVVVGNFKSKIEAERNLVDIKKRYKNVFLIKPSK
ncbi:SPOR domain-containing protein [Flavobacterium hydatis]|jgi:hypothetical protein|uniref:SPOR domain-containing protein n=1 Tax=Flavobacterium hydatis TaxID=991 RepID=A0A086AEU7_FLAHY|nr:SPOR domain-containing protein [Flavobacterium hydatis]KFF15211.1 sporulation protein [Flavobacterium hydatis]OXA92976.1 SPOR domain-containing protein [Flavobacterium hydatis]